MQAPARRDRPERREDFRRHVRFFRDAARLRRWFARHHATAKELWIGYPKRGSGRSGVSYGEAVEEALCFGWIDGQVRSIDARSYANRYTPRRPGSAWSAANVERVGELTRSGRMHAAGLSAFDARRAAARGAARARPARWTGNLLGRLRAAPRAYAFFQEQPRYYRASVLFWVRSARKVETRARRLRALIERSRRGELLNLLAPFGPGVIPPPRRRP